MQSSPRFRPQSAGRRRPAVLPTTAARAAQITSGSFFDLTEFFPHARWAELEVFRPQVLYGSASDLRWLTVEVELGEVTLSTLDQAIFVLTQLGDTPLTNILRIVLWQTFHVPVYELFIGPGGTILASECEAQEGWHVEPGCAFSIPDDELIIDLADRKGLRTGLTGYLTVTPCACGRPGMRVTDAEIKGLKKRPRQAVRLAATA